MNLLPFVAIFLLIITLSYNTLFSSFLVTKSTEKWFTTYIETLRKARNEIERQGYISSIPPPDKGTENKGEAKKEAASLKARKSKPKGYTSSRETPLTENSALNIATLFRKDDPKLQTTFTNLLSILYSHAPFYSGTKQTPDALSTILAEAIIQTGRKLDPAELNLYNIILQDSHLQEIWYKLLKGCTHYNISTKEGWPPLGTFIIIHADKERKPICFKKAAPQILTAHFGEEVASAILEEEKKRHFSEEKIRAILDEPALTTILIKHGVNNGKDHLQFKNPIKTKKTIRAVDESTQIAVEIQNLTTTPTRKTDSDPVKSEVESGPLAEF